MFLALKSSLSAALLAQRKVLPVQEAELVQDFWGEWKESGKPEGVEKEKETLIAVFPCVVN